MNRFTYLYQNGYYWSMSPGGFETSAYEYFHGAYGDAGAPNVSDGYGLRPVSKIKIPYYIT